MLQRRVFYGIDPEASDPKQAGFYWPESESKRAELMAVKRSKPDVYQSVYQCRPGSRIGSIFVDDDFSYYQQPPNLDLGVANPMVRNFLVRGWGVVTAWDTAFDSTAESDHTVGITAMLVPCEKYHRGEDELIFGQCEPHMDVIVVDVYREKIPWGDLPAKFREIHQRWSPVLHVVEKKGSGIGLYQSMPSIGLTVEGVEVNESKRTRAVMGTGAGSAQGWFRQHRVLFPREAPWLDRLKAELRDFTGEKDASDDQVDAIVHLINYAIKCGVGFALMSSDWSVERVDGLMGVTPEAINTTFPYPQGIQHQVRFINWIGAAPSLVEEPLQETCLNCTNQTDGFCKVQNRIVAMFDSCIEFSSDEEYAYG